MKPATNRANLFLLELIGNLVIFVLCAALCVGLIIRARSVSDDSAQLTQAVYLAQSTAEALRAGEDAPVAPEGYEIEVSAAGDTAEGTAGAQITVLCGGKEVYTLSAVWPEVE